MNVLSWFTGCLEITTPSWITGAPALHRTGTKIFNLFYLKTIGNRNVLDVFMPMIGSLTLWEFLMPINITARILQNQLNI